MPRFLLVFIFLRLLYFSLFSIVQAQNIRKPLRIFTTKDGLPQSFVSGLVQDKEGFVWIGTRNGLARFDGIQFRQFQHNSRDSTTITSNTINSLLIDKHNHIWIGHETFFIDRFDPVTEKVDRITDLPLFRNHPIRFSRRGLLADTAETLWCIDKNRGLSLYNWKMNHYVSLTKASARLLSDSIVGLVEDRHCQVWVVGLQGISRYDRRTEQFINFPFPFPFRFNFNAKSFIVLHERKGGELMMADREKLVFFNPANAGFRTIPFHTDEKSTAFIETGPDGAEYLETGGTVYRYEEAQGIVPVGMIDKSQSLESQAFLVDRSGVIWFSPNASGLQQIDLKAPFFESYPIVHSFHYDLLYKEFDLELDQFSGLSFTNSSFAWSSYNFRSAYDPRHRLWISLIDKVGYYNASQKKWVKLPPVPHVTTLRDPLVGVAGISFSPEGRLWAITNNKFIGYFDTAHQQWIPLIDTALPLKIHNVITMVDVKADANYLWISTSSGDGLLRVNTTTKEIRLFNQKMSPGLLPTSILLGLEPDASRPDLLWIGSYEGLICFNKKTLSVQVFTMQEGLPDNTIYSIQTDDAGFLWLSTNRGLCRFHPVTHQVRIFQTGDGLPGDEFNRFHHLKLPDGRLAFGGTDGWVLFNPATIKPDTYLPPIVFTGLQINYLPVSHTSKNSLLTRPLNELNELVLPYNQNTLEFEFAGLEYSQPKELLYRYRLKGYDDKWIVTAHPAVGYTHLPPGHYTLQINCTNTTKQWSQHIRELEIVVRPPLWQTWWAYTLYALVAAFLIWLFMRYRMNSTRLRQEVLLKEKEALQLKAVDEIKTRFFSNITHEFRTPLTLIIAPAGQMKKEVPSQSWKKQIDAIYNNARQLLHIVNQLLDMAKLEANSMKVTLYRGNPERFFEELIQPFLTAAASKQVQLHFTAVMIAEEYLFDADKLHIILTNLLSNAVKFTATGGTIRAAIQYQKTSNGSTDFSFIIQDSGVGIAPEKLPYIFDRFYQADDSSTRNYSGTGIGLALAKELAELMQGTLTASSEPGVGTTLILNLPLINASGSARPAYSTAMELAETTTQLPVPNEETIDADTIEHTGSPLVLVVEDNPELNDFITQIFRNRYRILTAANGAEGLRIANEELPDVIISDWMMPEMSGNLFCQAIKTSSATNHIAFILLTAKASVVSKVEALQIGADDYVTKPFVAEELLLRVANIVNRQQQLRRYYQHQLSIPNAQELIPSDDVPLSTDPFLELLYAIVDAHLDDPELNVDKLAVKSIVSSRTLGRKLFALTGLSPTDFIKQYRLKKAAEFLKQGIGVAETTYRVGYGSPAHFSTLFKSVYGVAPSEYAKDKEGF